MSKGIDAKGTYLEVLSDFSDKTLEGELANEELGRFLVTSDLAEGNSTRPEAMRLLDSPGGVLDNE
jgi:hypothetical protein